MGKLAELSLQYFSNTPAEQLREDWENLKKFNDHGPDMLAVLNNYGRGCGLDFNYSYFPEEIVLTVSPEEFSTEYSDSNLCLAA